MKDQIKDQIKNQITDIQKIQNEKVNDIQLELYETKQILKRVEEMMNKKSQKHQNGDVSVLSIQG